MVRVAMVDKEDDAVEVGSGSAAAGERRGDLAEPDGCGISTATWAEIWRDDMTRCGKFGRANGTVEGYERCRFGKGLRLRRCDYRIDQQKIHHMTLFDMGQLAKVRQKFQHVLQHHSVQHL